MPDSNPGDGIFYLPLKPMVDSYFLTQHACIGNGNELCVILQQITGRKSVTRKNHLLVAFLGFFFWRHLLFSGR